MPGEEGEKPRDVAGVGFERLLGKAPLGGKMHEPARRLGPDVAGRCRHQQARGALGLGFLLCRGTHLLTAPLLAAPLVRPPRIQTETAMAERTVDVLVPVAV